MLATIRTWTTERVELLKEHFEAGLSCREIAVNIGVSRNAVIGKLTRLGLTGGVGNAEQRPRKTGGERSAKSVAGLQFQILQTFYDGKPPPDDAPIASERRCSLFELSEQRCRWPISSPGAEDFSFCGNMPLDGLPYCPGHSRLAYRPGSRARVVRAC